MASSSTQERLNRQGKQHISALANTARALWVSACAADGIPPDSKFVVFSSGNRFAEFYNLAMLQLAEARAQYANGGYVGLQIIGGRA